jgi:EmrB/QacA subfamily drug resistance transporter
MDASVLNVALPSIQHDFHASISGAQWTLDAYTLVIACLLMLSASTGDRIGRRKVFQTGLVTFSVGSFLCSIAPGLDWLILFRMLQAIGGSMLNPVALSIITNTFIEPKARARAIGVWGGVIGVSIAIGPLLGGALVETVGWRAIFLINVPIGVLAFILAAMFVPESKAAHGRKVDPIGQTLVIAAVGLMIYGIIEAPAKGWSSTEIISCLVGSIVCLGGLIAYELKHTEPLIDVRFFRSAPFSGATAIAVCAFVAQGGFLLLNTLYLQDIRHFSPFKAGLAVLPMPAMMAILGPLSGRLVAKYGPRRSLISGGVGILIAGIYTMLTALIPSGIALYLVYGLMGAGLGFINTAISNTAVSGMPRDQAGIAAGITSTMRQLGTALGVAIIGSIIATRAAGLRPGSDFTSAYHLSWGLISGIGLVIFILGITTTGMWAKNTAKRNADRMQAASASRLEPTTD